MRTSIINQFIRGIFFIGTVLILTACTGKNDIILEPERQGSGTEEISEITGAEEIAETANADGTTSEPGGKRAPVEDAGAVSQDIYVHICGAVAKPGVYVLKNGSRVYEGVEAAGGFTENACEDFVNQAGVLTDGQKLIIPSMEEAEAARADGSYQEIWLTEAQEGSGKTETGTDAGKSDGLVNINTAAEQELSAIPGIGAGKASAIVKYRQENGAFTSIEDIMKVSGIKEGTFEKIKDKITVN